MERVDLKTCPLCKNLMGKDSEKIEVTQKKE